MKSKYDKLYKIILDKGFVPDYVKNTNGFLSLQVFPKNYEIGMKYFKLTGFSKDELISRFLEVLQ